jgi:hypothetical protein
MFSEPIGALVGVVAASCSIEVSPEQMKEHFLIIQGLMEYRNLRYEVHLGQWQETR